MKPLDSNVVYFLSAKINVKNWNLKANSRSRESGPRKAEQLDYLSKGASIHIMPSLTTSPRKIFPASCCIMFSRLFSILARDMLELKMEEGRVP